MYTDNNQRVFFELLRAGLFPVHGEGVMVNDFSTVDWQEVYRLATEQSVLGLVLAGIERIKNLNANLNLNIPQALLLQMIGEVQVIEQRNKAMNEFVAKLIEKLRKNDVYAILVKGQGIAQCYDKPLWRASGDVDLLLSDSNYEKAKKLLVPLASDVETEYTHFKHLGMTINGFVVELHGTLHSRLSRRVDRMIDGVQRDVFYGGKVRSWLDGQTQVFLPAPDEDVIFVFTHILHHFFFEGIGLRQICDWCRLLYCYREKLDLRLLESRIKKAGLVSEWKAFGAFAIEYLGFPKDSMPLLNVNDDLDANLKRKADRIMEFVLESGNFGHNRDMSYYGKYPYVIRKAFSMFRRIGDLVNHARIFPVNSVRFFFGIMYNGIRSAINGE